MYFVYLAAARYAGCPAADAAQRVPSVHRHRLLLIPEPSFPSRHEYSPEHIVIFVLEPAAFHAEGIALHVPAPMPGTAPPTHENAVEPKCWHVRYHDSAQYVCDGLGKKLVTYIARNSPRSVPAVHHARCLHATRAPHSASQEPSLSDYLSRNQHDALARPRDKSRVHDA